MTTLREEIERIQKSYYVPSYSISDSVDDIIKEFEKRIDKIEEINRDILNDGVRIGFMIALNKVKEMINES